MTLCIYLWDVLYAIATDPGTIAMVQGFGFSMKIQGFTLWAWEVIGRDKRSRPLIDLFAIQNFVLVGLVWNSTWWGNIKIKFVFKCLSLSRSGVFFWWFLDLFLDFDLGSIYWRDLVLGHLQHHLRWLPNKSMHVHMNFWFFWNPSSLMFLTEFVKF
jgi:hypothetical protein